MARAAIIDTDPGIDDAVAILLALGSPELDVLGITTVAGNIGIDTVTRNAGGILALAGCPEIPVVPGASRPLARTGFDTADIHGRDGLGGVAFPEPETVPLAGPAWAWMANVLDSHPAGTVDLLALGPLTNVAMLVSKRPDAALRIGRVIAMGGAVHEPGNIGGRAEFNLAADPEAAETVFSAALPLTLVPLDVTRQVRATLADTALLRRSGAPRGIASAALIEAYFRSTGTGTSRPLHDPCVVLLAMRSDLFGVSTLPLRVSTGGDPGVLLPAEEAPPIQVAMTVDAAAALSLLLARLG